MLKRKFQALVDIEIFRKFPCCGVFSIEFVLWSRVYVDYFVVADCFAG
jgi:hypothetical protein